MGMFNSIMADLRCPKTRDIAKDCEIQIKWQEKRKYSVKTSNFFKKN
jgi:hypothetical protein